MNEVIAWLAERAGSPRMHSDDAADRALARLNRVMDALAAELEVAYVGPAVGVEERQVHRLVIDAHAWKAGGRAWGLRVCSALPAGGWRAEWTLDAVGRLRRALVVAALPALMSGYAAAVTAAGRHETPAGRRVRELARSAGAPR